MHLSSFHHPVCNEMVMSCMSCRPLACCEFSRHRQIRARPTSGMAARWPPGTKQPSPAGAGSPKHRSEHSSRRRLRRLEERRGAGAALGLGPAPGAPMSGPAQSAGPAPGARRHGRAAGAALRGCGR